jgi:hypothetical protein
MESDEMQWAALLVFNFHSIPDTRVPVNVRVGTHALRPTIKGVQFRKPRRVF